eukprot:1196061-Prorocentrum_minimum.AAC.4
MVTSKLSQIIIQQIAKKAGGLWVSGRKCRKRVGQLDVWCKVPPPAGGPRLQAVYTDFLGLHEERALVATPFTLALDPSQRGD